MPSPRPALLALGLAISLAALAPAPARAHGPGHHLRFLPQQDWNQIAGLSPLDAALRVIDLPDEARRLLRTPAPESAPLAIPPPPSGPLSGALTAGAAALPLALGDELRGWPLGGTPGRMSPWPDPTQDPHDLALLLAPSTGVRDPVRAKALSLVVQGHRLVWISVDTCMAPENLVIAVNDRLRAAGVRSDLTLVSASHTHSGPGRIDARPFVWMAMDLHDPRLAGRVADWCAAAALAAVRAESSALAGWGEMDVSGLVTNRRDPAQEAARTFDLLHIKRLDGATVAALVLGPMHATMLDETNRRFSADVVGTIERGLEARLPAGAVAMVVQGAEGDQAPRVLDGEAAEAAMERIGAELSTRAAQALPGIALRRATALDWHAVRWLPPRALLRPGLMEPRIPRFITIPLGKLAEPGGMVSAVRIGGRALVTVPGEPILALGNQVCALGEEAGLGPTRVCGLTNGYVGYIATPEEYDRGGYEALATLYGSRTAASLLGAAGETLRELSVTRTPGALPSVELER